MTAPPVRKLYARVYREAIRNYNTIASRFLFITQSVISALTNTYVNTFSLLLPVTSFDAKGPSSGAKH
jgi:hypothetical protein